MMIHLVYILLILCALVVGFIVGFYYAIEEVKSNKDIIRYLYGASSDVK